MGQLAHPRGVVLDQHVGDGLPQVPQEPLTGLAAFHSAAGEGWQPGKNVVAAAAAELIPHPRRPVLRARLPTVDVRGDECLARAARRAVLGHEPRDEILVVDLGGLLAELVGFQSAAGHRGGMVVDGGRRVAKPQDEPAACGDLPIEPAAGGHLRSEFDDIRPRNHRLGRQRRELGRLRRKVLWHVRGLALNRRQPHVLFRHRHRQHGDVAIIVAQRFRLLERVMEVRWALDDGLCPDDLLHRELRRDPRPAAAAPAGVVVHVDFQPQSLCLAASMPEKVPPEWSGKRGRAPRGALFRLHVKHPADSDPLHGFEIGGNTLLAQVAVQREPVDPRSRGGRWLGKAFGEILGCTNRHDAASSTKSEQ